MKRAGNESRCDGSPMEGSARENAGNCRRGRANLPSACEEGGQKAAHAGERTVDTAENRARPGSIADSGEASADSGDAFAGRVDAAWREDTSVGREDAARRDAVRAGTSLAPSNVQAGIGAGQGELGLRLEMSAGEGAAGSHAAALESGAQTQRTDSGERSDDALREKLLRAHAGDAQAREELISENLALVRFLVKRFAGRGADMEDLFRRIPAAWELVEAVDQVRSFVFRAVFDVCRAGHPRRDPAVSPRRRADPRLAHRSRERPPRGAVLR